MSLPVLLRSDMTGAPALTSANGQIINLLTACLVNGFNTQSVSSATASGGVVTFNFAAGPGFSALDTVTIAGATNSTVNGQFRTQSASGNQVLVAIPGVPDGAVTGTITMKFSPLGWTRPYTGTNLAVYRQGGASTTKRFLRIYDGETLTAGRFRARGYENMTAVSTGTGPFPTTAQVAGNGTEQMSTYYQGSSYPTAPRHWIVIGTPRFFAVYIGYYMEVAPWDEGPLGTVAPITTFRRSQASIFWFGDPANIFKPADAYACMLPIDYQGQRPYFPRAYTGAGSAIEGWVASIGAVGYLQTNLGGGGPPAYPNPSDGGVHLMPAPFVYDYLNNQNNVRGTFPGILQMIENPFESYTGQEPHIGQILQNIPGVTGRVMIAAHAYASAQSIPWLLDEDWGDL